MDLGIGDIFNCRVAGNVANEDILGSMEFACKLAGAKVVLVMGHTACGAIKGAIDNAQLGNLTGLLSKVQPAVQATSYSGERSASNYSFVDAVARKNVELTLANIRRDSPVLAELETMARSRRRRDVRPAERRRGFLPLRVAEGLARRRRAEGPSRASGHVRG